MTLLDFVRLTRAHLRLILVMLALGVVLAAAYTFTRPQLYTSTASGQVYAGGSTSTAEALTGLTLGVDKAQVYASYIDSKLVSDGIADHFLSQGDPVPSCALGASNNNISPEIVVSATCDSPEQARAVADAAVKTIARVADKLESASVPEDAPKGAQASVVRIVPLENASLPTSPSSPDWRRNLVIGGLIGLVIGYVVALARRSLDRRIRYVADVEELVGKSVLAVVPQMKSLNRGQAGGGLDTSTRGPAVESLRQLRTNLRFVDVDHPPRSVVVTSANAGEGKTTVSANLARLLAEAGQRTLLLEADMRRPVIGRLFGIDAEVGLTQVLARDLTVAETIVPISDDLSILPSGRIPPNPSELLGSQRMSQLLKELTEEYLVILDAPPLLPVSDAGLLAGTADGTLLVLAVGSTYKEQARLSAQRLDQVGGHLLGAVVNKAPMKGIGAVVYGYGYGYGTYSSSYNYYGEPGTRKAKN